MSRPLGRDSPHHIAELARALDRIDGDDVIAGVGDCPGKLAPSAADLEHTSRRWRKMRGDKRVELHYPCIIPPMDHLPNWTRKSWFDCPLERSGD
jgi:hypothetical protein